MRYAAQTLRTNWRERRAIIALLVLAGIPAQRILATLNKRGHGI